MSDKTTPVDFAKLDYGYHEDPDLAIIADTLADEHGMGWLVWLYWPRIVAKAKQAQSLGWFKTTPRNLASSIHDPIAAAGLWAARARMWELLAQHDLIRVKQGAINTPSDQVDVLLVNYEKWQATSNKERQKLKRERTKFAAGEAVHWTVRHWSEFAYTPVSCDTEIPCGDTEIVSRDTEIEPRDTEHAAFVTTRDETRRDETKEGARSRALPTSVLEAIEQVRDIPGMSRRQLESNVRKAMAQFPSLDDAAACEAIAAFESSIPEGSTLRSGQSWTKLRNCFSVARRIMDEQASPQQVQRGSRFEPGSPAWKNAMLASLGSPETAA